LLELSSLVLALRDIKFTQKHVKVNPGATNGWVFVVTSLFAIIDLPHKSRVMV